LFEFVNFAQLLTMLIIANTARLSTIEIAFQQAFIVVFNIFHKLYKY